MESANSCDTKGYGKTEIVGIGDKVEYINSRIDVCYTHTHTHTYTHTHTHAVEIDNTIVATENITFFKILTQ